MVPYTALASIANVALIFARWHVRESKQVVLHLLMTHIRLVSQNDALSSCESSDKEDRSSNIPRTSTSSDGADDQEGLSCSDFERKCTYLQNIGH